MTPIPPIRWRTPREFPVHRRSWGDDTVAFHEGSGDVHLLGPIEAATLGCLDGPAIDLDTLIANVAKLLNLEPDAALRAHLEAILPELQNLGLIETAPA